MRAAAAVRTRDCEWYIQKVPSFGSSIGEHESAPVPAHAWIQVITGKHRVPLAAASAGRVLLRTTCRCHPRTETPVSAWWGLDYPARVGTHSKSVATTRWECVGVNHTQFSCPYQNNSECPHARTPSRLHASTPARSRVRARTRTRTHARAARPHVLQNAPARNEYWMFGALDGVQLPVVQRRGTGADGKSQAGCRHSRNSNHNFSKNGCYRNEIPGLCHRSADQRRG